MNAVNKTLAISTLLFSCSSAIGVEVEYSGFGSITAGRVISSAANPNSSMAGRGYSGAAYMADYPNVGIYEGDWSLRPESLLGLQGKLKASDKLEFTAQLTARAINSPRLDVDWLYASYSLTPNLRVQAGRKRLPLYHYSDFVEVAYAYPWVRAPELAYSWQITHYNGINLLYEDYYKDWDYSANFYGGEEKDEDSRLLRFFFPEKVEEHWDNIFGTTFGVSNDWLEVRLSVMKNQVKRTVGSGPQQNGRLNFYGLSAKAQYGNLTFLTEQQRIKRRNYTYPTDIHVYSIDYQINDFKPYVAYNDFINPTLGEDHHTVSAGVRWDFHRNMAGKLQFDRYFDDGTAPLGGNADLISASIDFTF